MPSSKKPTSGKSDKKESTAAREPIPSTSTAAQEPLFPPGGDIHEHLRTVLRIPTTTDTRAPPTVLYRTAHALPTRQAAQDIPSEPHRDREISAAEAAPHLLPPSRNGIYPTTVVNDFYESISVDRTVNRLPPVPKIPIRTKDIRKVFFELSDDYKTLAMPNVIIERQPGQQNYFLELDDLLLCDYIVEFRNSNMPPLRRHYSSQMTLTDPAALAGLQHQSDIVAGYNRLKRTDYCALAQVIVHSDIAGFEYFPLQQLSMTPIKVCFEYVTLHNGLAFWSLPLSIRPTAPVVYQTANYDSSMKPLLYPQEHSVPQRFHPRKPEQKEQTSSSSGMDL